MGSAANIGGLSLLFAVFLSGAGASPTPSPGAEEGQPPAILVSRQLLASEHLAIGDVVALSSDPKGAHPKEFRIAGVYEPIPDPARLGAAALEARLHLPDLMDLTADPADPVASESVRSINVKLAEASDAAAFARELAARAARHPRARPGRPRRRGRHVRRARPVPPRHRASSP